MQMHFCAPICKAAMSETGAAALASTDPAAVRHRHLTAASRITFASTAHGAVSQAI